MKLLTVVLALRLKKLPELFSFMAIFILTDKLIFPSCDQADEDGLLAVGGDLSSERLLLAYRSGIFPWFAPFEPIQWWSPDPRFVLFPEHLYVSKSMKQVLKRNEFTWSVNTSFRKVIEQCALLRKEDGTWITEEMIEAYCKLHSMGYACSVETWRGDQLVGGLYGIRMGKMFFGESMFSSLSNASKFAFIQYVRQLQTEGVVCVDCQVYTDHLESLGASFISRQDFLSLLKEQI